MNISKFTGSMTLLAILAGCGEASMTMEQKYAAGKAFSIPDYKSGISVQEMQNDRLNCDIEAARRVPQNTQIKTTPTYTSPTQTICNKIGGQTFCNTTGGQTYGGNTYSEDVNASLRWKAQRQCMAYKGYRSVDVPPCPDGVTPQQLQINSNGTLPRLSRGTCYIATDEVQVIGNLQ